MEAHKQVNITDDILSTISKNLGYSRLQGWQVTLTENILGGKDVIFTAGTGCGKTTLLHAPLLAFRLKNPMAMGLSVTPTKTLGRDQVWRAFGRLLKSS
jgi:superfamily II DNA/RNA helicase